MLLKIRNLTHFGDQFITHLHDVTKNIALDDIKHIQFDNDEGFIKIPPIPESEMDTGWKRDMMDNLKQKYGVLLNIYDINSTGRYRAIYSIVYTIMNEGSTIHDKPLSIDHNASVSDLSCLAIRYIDNYLSSLNNSGIINLNDICDKIAVDIGWTFDIDINIAIIKFPINLNLNNR